jgi:hypothetical protein
MKTTTHEPLDYGECRKRLQAITTDDPTATFSVDAQDRPPPVDFGQNRGKTGGCRMAGEIANGSTYRGSVL